MTQIYGREMQTFVRTIMPELYRLQEKCDNRRKPKGAVYHLADPDDMKDLLEALSDQVTAESTLLN